MELLWYIVLKIDKMANSYSVEDGEAVSFLLQKWTRSGMCIPSVPLLTPSTVHMSLRLDEML